MVNSKVHKPEPHTIVRFKLRSLLAITFGVALVMTVVGPWLRALDAEQQHFLLYQLISVFAGMCCSVYLTIKKRQRLGMQSGRLLLALEAKQRRNRNYTKWLWLLLWVPLAILYAFSISDPSSQSGNRLLSMAIGLFFPFYWSLSLGKYGLSVWAEGYGNEVEFCENGIVINDHLHSWSSKTVRHLHWNMAENNLVLNINRHVTTAAVPAHQREAVEAILEHYYRPHHRQTTDQT